MRNRSSLLLTPLLALLLLAGCSEGDDGRASARPPPVVTVTSVERSSGAHTEVLVGRLSALRRAEVRARVGGILLERVYREGSDVAEGELLFRIDPAPLAAERKAREAELARATARAGNARARTERLRGLAGRGLVPAQDLEDAEAARREADAAVLEARAQLDKARLSLAYAEVRAPIAGRAGKALVTEGALVGEREATALTTIEQVDSLYVDFTVSVASWELLRGMQAAAELPRLRLRTPGGRAYPHPAEVQFSELAVDPRTGTIALRAIVPNPERELLPGMFANLEVEMGGDRQVIRVPQTAVLRDGDGAYVLVLDAQDIVQRRDVRLDGATGNEWIIGEGLSEGERLILDGLQRVRPGAPAQAATTTP
jgi:membrane fusion protein, multidrug efflux system